MLKGAEFKKYPLWIAHYRTPYLKDKFSGWHFWQHSGRGRVNGIRGGVGFNVFDGDIEDLATKTFTELAKTFNVPGGLYLTRFYARR